MSKLISTKDCVFCKHNGKIISGGYPLDKLLGDTNSNSNTEKKDFLIGGTYIVPTGLSISNRDDLSSRHEHIISNYMIGGSSNNKTDILPDAMIHRFYDNADIRKRNNNIKKDNIKKEGQIKTRKLNKHKHKYKNKKTRKII